MKKAENGKKNVQFKSEILVCQCIHRFASCLKALKLNNIFFSPDGGWLVSSKYENKTSFSYNQCL